MTMAASGAGRGLLADWPIHHASAWHCLAPLGTEAQPEEGRALTRCPAGAGRTPLLSSHPRRVGCGLVPRPASPWAACTPLPRLLFQGSRPPWPAVVSRWRAPIENFGPTKPRSRALCFDTRVRAQVSFEEGRLFSWKWHAVVLNVFSRSFPPGRAGHVLQPPV